GRTAIPNRAPLVGRAIGRSDPGNAGPGPGPLLPTRHWRNAHWQRKESVPTPSGALRLGAIGPQSRSNLPGRPDAPAKSGQPTQAGDGTSAILFQARLQAAPGSVCFGEIVPTHRPELAHWNNGGQALSRGT